MKTPRHTIAALLAQRSLAPGLNTKQFSRSIAAYLLETGRTGELSSLMRDVMEYRAEHGIVEVVAVSAHELSTQVQTDIRTQVKRLQPDAKHIIISEVIDPNVIGGVRLELPHQQLDLSVRGKLNRFKQLTAVGE
jgi:F0F1-type ATP synthase delta subunit